MGFFKTMLASMVGTVLSGLILIFLFIFIISSVFQSGLEDFADNSDKAYTVKPKSVLHLKLNNPIDDNGPEENFIFSGDGFSNDNKDGLNSIIASIRRAANDKMIKGIYLDVQFLNTGMATVEELRNELLNFKKS
jgi:protease-4